MFERFTKAARIAIVTAQEEARLANSDHIDVEHVLIGVLDAADPSLRALVDAHGLTVDSVRAAISGAGAAADPLGAEDAEALRSIGIDLDAIRESLDANFGEDALNRAVPTERRGFFNPRRFGHIPFTAGAKKVVEQSLREALAHKDDRIGAEHVLLGVLGGPSPTARKVIEAHVGIDELRRQVLELLDRAA
ncbi:Clp protease [Antrihabitans sp. YC3-6]|uniref:Clp protease n=1 Tax=Antrihabitans stalagmiti TaxID=2799499 RepID=A0A934NPA1_9NOCA|nr:Clp protease N-terminal domain-containing protein [Antrihabitans stalagmiti]MBJ8338923.1 Clp protease [Antrihabitans stalagmiti]